MIPPEDRKEYVLAWVAWRQSMSHFHTAQAEWNEIMAKVIAQQEEVLHEQGKELMQQELRIQSLEERLRMLEALR